MLTKSGASTTLIGHYELLFYLGFVLTSFWVVGLMQGFLSQYPRLADADRPAYLFNTYVLLLFVSAVLFSLMCLAKKPLLLALTGQTDLPHYELFTLYLLVHTPTFLVENLYLIFAQARKIVGYGLFAFGLQALVILVPIFMGWGLGAAIMGLLFLALAKHLWLWVELWHKSQFSFSRIMIKELVVLSWPLILYTLVAGFHQTFDQWMVNFKYAGDETQFAVFRYGARELPVAIALATALSTALLPVVSAQLEEGLAQIKAKTRKLFHLLFPLSIGLMLSSSWFFPRVFNAQFSDSVLIFNVFLLLVSSRVILTRTIMVGLGANRAVFGCVLLGLLFNIGMSFLLFPHWGMAGIAGGTVLAYFAEVALFAFYLYRFHAIRLGQYLDLKWYLLYSVLLLGAFLWGLA
ncbi:MAG TPA: polysaccharide biosynthesis C-terminal domain-containing protein [Saprospiraceae bacterium]|nr:polysaccharide biosynthesis C-terminal domain-containing protein [Saprospiraceae bacterium]HMQ85708.1 polysaccharide biosynthesis C-terminal domain-containing protein [Saprospiraceae bacterium]